MPLHIQHCLHWTLSNPTSGGHLRCTACRSPFLFFDRLRHVAVASLDEDPTRQAEIADVLLTVGRNGLQHSVDFKQMFLAKGFMIHEGGDSYYGKKGMLWWGAGVYVKPDTWQDDRSTESIEEHNVEIDFTTEYDYDSRWR